MYAHKHKIEVHQHIPKHQTHICMHTNTQNRNTSTHTQSFKQKYACTQTQNRSTSTHNQTSKHKHACTQTRKIEVHQYIPKHQTQKCMHTNTQNTSTPIHA